MAVDLENRKRVLRRRMHRVRNSLTAEFRSPAEEAIASAILNIPQVKEALWVLAYSAFRGEVDLAPVLSALAGRVALPRVEPDGDLSARPFGGEGSLVTGSFGISEPSTPPLEWSQVQVALVPGIAFDASGNRLGYGGGFFDRTLANFDGFKIGVAFDCQIVDEVPSGPGDVRMDALVTESGLRFS